MKVNRLETHDRLEHFLKDQAQTIWQGADDCLKKNTDSLKLQEKSPYIYVFAHPRTADDGITKRMLWQPRLTKPKAQTNSYLFRALSNTDLLEICWLIPPRELWPQYQAGNITEEPTVVWSINQFMYNREELEKPEPEDWSDWQARNILEIVLRESIQSKRASAAASSVLQESK